MAAYNTRAPGLAKFMTATTFSIAHLSDPHLTLPQATNWRQLCNKRVLGLMSWRRRRRYAHQPAVLAALVEDLRAAAPDHTVVTGDLTQIGLPDEFAQAGDWLQALGGPGAVSVIPGNHDTYVAERWDRTYALWTDYIASDEATSWSAGDFPSLRIRGPAAIIGLNSAFPADWLRAVGRIGHAQLQRLAAVLAAPALADQFRLVLVHHAPVAGVDPWRKRLLDCRQLAAVLSAGKAHLVLHGHDHRTSWAALPGDPQIPVIAVPSASFGLDVPGKHAGYHIYHLTRSVSGWRVAVEVRGLRDGSFVEVERRTMDVPIYA
jgi:3',5'-cyclic AMP phosphodiesterase CpdA